MDDKIHPVTRVVGLIVIPFLWIAFHILFFNPDLSGERFAWAIKPHMTAMYIGAGYIGGSWVLVHAVIGKKWHRIASGFYPSVRSPGSCSLPPFCTGTASRITSPSPSGSSSIS